MRISKSAKIEFEKLFEEAVKLRESGSLYEAIKKLKAILSGNPKYDTAVLGIMGNIYWELSELNKALKCYRKAVELNPKSEMASLGLFHTLWKLGKEDEGFDEMERFLSISNSKEYSLLLDELGESLPKKTNKV